MATEETRDNEAVEEAYNRAVDEIYENNKPVSKADKKAAKKAKKEGNEVLPIEEEVASGDENKTWTQKHKNYYRDCSGGFDCRLYHRFDCI